jgi:hypothetical protein
MLVAGLRARARRMHEAGKQLAINSDGGVGAVRFCRDIEADYVSALNLWPRVDDPTGVMPS